MPTFLPKQKLLAAALLLLLAAPRPAAAQTTPDPWKITADKIDPANYYGATVANGVMGVVSSPEPFKVKNVVLAGAYDQYGRGRVSNFLNGINLLNMYMEIDGRRLGAKEKSRNKKLAVGERAMADLAIWLNASTQNCPGDP